VLDVPLVLFAPVQPVPPAVQDVGLFVALQLIFALLPVVMDIGLALIVTTGAGGLVTVRGTLFWYPVPPALVQLRLNKYVLALEGVNVRVPEAVGVIDPDQSPLAVQDVGLFVARQLMVVLLPTVTELGLTLNDTDGGLGTTVMGTLENVLPLALPQVSVYVYTLSVVSAPVLNEPVAGLLPDQSPLAVQLVGLLLASQLIVTLVPRVTGLSGALEIVTSGVSGGGSIVCTVAVANPEPALLVHVSV
jgi:hypothetical protein